MPLNTYARGHVNVLASEPMMTLEIKATANGSILSVRAQPGAKRNAITGCHAGALKISVTAPPDRGRANEAIVEVLAETLGISRSTVTIISGQTSRQKKFAIEGMQPKELQDKLGDGG